MQNVPKILASLHQYERTVLPKLKDNITVQELVASTGLKEIEVVRALQWLSNKKILEITVQPQEYLDLGKNGILYKKKGLPERRFLTALKGAKLTLTKIGKQAALTKDELNVCIGQLRSKGHIYLFSDKELTVKLTSTGEQALAKKLPEELFLEKEFPAPLSSLKGEEKGTLEQLRKRKDIVIVELKKTKQIKILPLGKEILSQELELGDYLDLVTPEMLRTGKWKEKQFRRYDVMTSVPAVTGGRKHPYRRFLDSVRQEFIRLGFTEMNGPLVESEFYNMDALFMPQFHSARDIHDVYFAKDIEAEEIDPKLIRNVQAAHENGFGTGSTGWKYKFDAERTKRRVLRSHDTAISPRTLASKELKIPGKYFQTVRCFRKDVIDATHNCDFYQTGGFVIEEGLTFRHLIGLLKMFAKEFVGVEEVKIVPAYFPFTEPSCELHAKHPQLGWIELAGAGFFRPEMIKPLVGSDIPVIAWGIGIDRIAMFKLGLNDIRQLFSRDLDYLRTTPLLR